jgi:hypothetical protein
MLRDSFVRSPYSRQIFKGGFGLKIFRTKSIVEGKCYQYMLNGTG